MSITGHSGAKMWGNGNVQYLSNSWGGIFAPTDVSGLQLWLDANDNSTLTVSGSYVNQWNDKSGKGNNATNYSSNSTKVQFSATGFNNKPAIVFQYYNGLVANSPVGTFNNGICIFVIFTSNAYGGHYDTLITKTFSNVPAPIDMYNSTIISGNKSSFTSINSSLNLSNIVNNLNLYSVFLSNNCNVQEYVNGALYLNQNFPTQSYGDLATNIYIGTRSDKATCFNGVISEVLVYNTMLSDTQRQKTEGYLAWKWNLTSNLPNSHPYKLLNNYNGASI